MKKILLAVAIVTLGLTACSNGNNIASSEEEKQEIRFTKLQHNQQLRVQCEYYSTFTCRLGFGENENNSKYYACYEIHYNDGYVSGKYEDKAIYYRNDLETNTLSIKIYDVFEMTYHGTFYYWITTNV